MVWIGFVPESERRESTVPRRMAGTDPAVSSMLESELRGRPAPVSADYSNSRSR
jgi:hypothetical protein